MVGEKFVGTLSVKSDKCSNLVELTIASAWVRYIRLLPAKIGGRRLFLSIYIEYPSSSGATFPPQGPSSIENCLLLFVYHRLPRIQSGVISSARRLKL